MNRIWCHPVGFLRVSGSDTYSFECFGLRADPIGFLAFSKPVISTQISSPRNNSGKPWYVPYYAYSWFEFLRRNKEYEDTCRSGGEGRLNGLYKDFGDVFNLDFKTWWKTDDRGATLFANALPPEFKIIKDSSEFIENPNVIYIQIPLELPKSFLHRKRLALPPILNFHPLI